MIEYTKHCLRAFTQGFKPLTKRQFQALIK
jgi:hypothetical protein